MHLQAGALVVPFKGHSMCCCQVSILWMLRHILGFVHPMVICHYCTCFAKKWATWPEVMLCGKLRRWATCSVSLQTVVLAEAMQAGGANSFP